jgi:hypothetical protein
VVRQGQDALSERRILERPDGVEEGVDHDGRQRHQQDDRQAAQNPGGHHPAARIAAPEQGEQGAKRNRQDQGDRGAFQTIQEPGPRGLRREAEGVLAHEPGVKTERERENLERRGEEGDVHGHCHRRVGRS